MSLYQKTVNEFIELVDSDFPTPGGGTSSALMSVLGISLSRMVAHLTVDKKKFKNLDEETQKEFIDTQNKLLEIKQQIIPLIDEDSESFNAIMRAFKLPRETDEDKRIRRKAIDDSTLVAIEVPYKIAKTSLMALENLEIMLNHGNESAISDLGVCTLALSSGIEGAMLNVLINLVGHKDQELIDYYKKETKKILEKTKNIKEHILKEVYIKLEYV